VGRIYGDVIADECDAGRAFLDFFYRGVVAVDEDNSDVPGFYVILPAYNDDVAARCRYFLFCAKCKLIRVSGLIAY
jgi:hypothetical protein